MATPTMFDVSKRKRYIFKKHPFKLVLDDLEGAFYRAPMGVMHVEDICAYIYWMKEPVRLDRISSHMETLMKLDMTFMDEFMHLENNPIIEYVTAYEFYESEWIKILLSKIHDDLFWIGEVPVRITTKTSLQVL